MLAARPTGRPEAQAFVDTVNQKFADAKAALLAARPTGRPVGGNKHQHNQAKWEVRILEYEPSDSVNELVELTDEL